MAGLSLSGADAANYNLIGTIPTLSATIAPAPLTFTGTALARKVYDPADRTGPPVSAITITTPSSFSGLIGSDSFTLSSVGVTAIGDFSTPGPCFGVALPYTGAFSLGSPTGGALASNYALSVTLLGEEDDYIELKVVITAANQTVVLNEYFANAFAVDWGDGSSEPVTGTITHPYAATGTYTIRLTSALYGQYQAWAFSASGYLPLISKPGTTAASVSVSYMPPMERFQPNASSAPDYFFTYFNSDGALSSLPAGSFDISSITAAGDFFFAAFNSDGALSSLPAGSFNISSITSVGDFFFTRFNSRGSLSSLPVGSFDTSSITTAGDYFFATFNQDGHLVDLPAGSFDTSSITTAGESFFDSFNRNGPLASLPAGSFNISSITIAGEFFFADFNYEGALASLPVASFNTSSITRADDNFFAYFNYDGDLASLPAGSFNISSITIVPDFFFAYFNYNGALVDLPDDSFNTSRIATAGSSFFAYFNSGGALVDLPRSFCFPALTSIQVDQNGMFQNSFNSTVATLNISSVIDIIGGCATPSTSRNTFSSNQPGYGSLATNWKAP
jgi:hypothetical protein